MRKHHFPQGLAALSSDPSSDAPSFYFCPSSLACGLPLPLRSAALSPCAQRMRTGGVDPVPPQPFSSPSSPGTKLFARVLSGIFHLIVLAAPL